MGRVDIVENRFVGIKSRGVYETPGGTLLHHAHRAVESITLDREVAHLRDELMPRYAEMVYNGFWFAPERRALQAFMDDVQKRVNGEARLRLYKGSVAIEGRRSEKYDLYDQATATFEQDEVYDQADAAGFHPAERLAAAPNRRGTARGGGVTAVSSRPPSPSSSRRQISGAGGSDTHPPTPCGASRSIAPIGDCSRSTSRGLSLTWRCCARVGLLDRRRASHDHRRLSHRFSPRPGRGRSPSAKPMRMSIRQSSAGWWNWSGRSARNSTPGRSRNDQMALDLRLYLQSMPRGVVATTWRSSPHCWPSWPSAHAETLIPSYTHLQQAQTTSLGHHLLAYAWMALRDRDRLADLDRRLESPLGAGASAGSSLPLDPMSTATDLGFARTFDNSLDAVGSRDLVAEFVFVATQAMVHLSRLSEELVLWSTTEFGWVTFSDSHTTGSSALPHKKNPDIAELVRGKAAAAIGDLTTLLVLQKSLPLAYNRDLQEDKPPLFRADDALAGSLEALAGMMAGADFHPPPPGPLRRPSIWPRPWSARGAVSPGPSSRRPIGGSAGRDGPNRR